MRSAILSISLALFCSSTSWAQTPGRHAFFLINTEYRGIPPLPVDTAGLEGLRSALIEAKFGVREARNLTQEQLTTGLEKTLMAGVKPGDTLLFYYFGYAIQADRDNFLLPIDFDPGNSMEITYRATSLTGILQLLESEKVGTKILLIDASTQPPVPVKGLTATGLGDPDFAEIHEVTYLSGAAKNAVPVPLTPTERGLFIKHLAALIRKPGTLLSDLVANTPIAVNAESSKLLPYTSVQSSKPFRFTDPPPPPEPIKIIQTVAADTFLTQAQINRKDRQAYRYIPAGKFLMGCVPADTKCEDHEKPQHEVTITKAFWMGETEVQVLAYKRFAETSTPKKKMPMSLNGRNGWNDNLLPMANMSPEHAKAFCNWAGGRLPTEAEWEYAARAGKANEIVPLNAENARDKANFHGKQGNDNYDYDAPSKQFDANAFGLYDMFGNFWELTGDYYSKTYYAESPKEDPTGPPDGKEWVSRGGSWDSDPKSHLRISFRNKGKGGAIVGFRCVLPDSEETRKLLRP